MFGLIRELDFDDIDVVKQVCEGYQNFVEWNKGYFKYEIFYPQQICDEIYIAHNLWESGEICTSEEFFESLDDVLDDYLHMYGDEPTQEEKEIFFNQLINKEF